MALIPSASWRSRFGSLDESAPGWIGGAGDDRAKFYSQDNADFIASFIQGAKKYHGVAIDYCGIWNETPHEAAWIKRLRQTLDRTGLARVQIVAADEVQGNPWQIAGEMLADPELMNAAQGKAIGEWLELDFGQPTRFNTVHLAQFAQRITRCRIECQDGGQWQAVLSGNSARQDDWTLSFPEVHARKLRLVVLEVNGPPDQTPPSLYEFEVYQE